MEEIKISQALLNQDSECAKLYIQPKISIGIVVYNGASHIRNALDSIVSQSYKNIELIVVDGDSTDDTLAILKEYEKHISILVSEPDNGIYDAMNKVCSLATGDWLIFIGCDDVLLNGLPEIANKLVDLRYVYYGNVIKLSNGKVYDGEFSKDKFIRRNICHQAIFYPLVIYTKYSYDLKYKLLADYVYNLKLWMDQVQFVYINELITLYNDKGQSTLGDIEFLRDRAELMQATFGKTFVLLESLGILGLIDRVAMVVSISVKYLLPKWCVHYIRMLWRRFRNAI